MGMLVWEDNVSYQWTDEDEARFQAWWSKSHAPMALGERTSYIAHIIVVVTGWLLLLAIAAAACAILGFCFYILDQLILQGLHDPSYRPISIFALCVVGLYATFLASLMVRDVAESSETQKPPRDNRKKLSGEPSK
jgi:hypothetical protein